MDEYAPRPGDFCWFELATTDQAAARRFYESLFGWSSEDLPMGPSDLYTIFKLDGRNVAAAYTMRPEHRAKGMPPNWLVYVQVESADAAAARAASLGANVGVKPVDVPGSGRMSVMEDPAGAMFAVWQPKPRPGVQVHGEPGSIAWADLQARDQVRLAEFYSALFGWKMVEGKSILPAKPGDYYHIVNDSRFIGGIPPSEHVDPTAHPAWLIYVEVADCRAATARAGSLGGRVHVDSMTAGGARFSVIADPQGAVFAVHETVQR